MHTRTTPDETDSAAFDASILHRVHAGTDADATLFLLQTNRLMPAATRPVATPIASVVRDSIVDMVLMRKRWNNPGQ